MKFYMYAVDKSDKQYSRPPTFMGLYTMLTKVFRSYFIYYANVLLIFIYHLFTGFEIKLDIV